MTDRTAGVVEMSSHRVRVKIKDRVKLRVRVRVRVSVSYIMTIWRWEEFSRCDKFPTTPDGRMSTTGNAAAHCLGKLHYNL